MFITDTVDAAYPPEAWSAYSLMDRLGEIVAARPDLIASNVNGTSLALPRMSIQLPRSSNNGLPGVSENGRKGRHSVRPLLAKIRQSKISSLASLEPFFSRTSLANYESVYALGNVDWHAVEESVEMDLFEGTQGE